VVLNGTPPPKKIILVTPLLAMSAFRPRLQLVTDVQLQRVTDHTVDTTTDRRQDLRRQDRPLAVLFIGEWTLQTDAVQGDCHNKIDPCPNLCKFMHARG